MDDLEHKVLISDLVEPSKGIVVARAFEPLSKAVVKRVSELGVKKIQIVDVSSDDGLIIRCMAKDPAHNEEDALKEIYKRLRPGDPPTPANARALVKRLFFDPKRYEISYHFSECMDGCMFGYMNEWNERLNGGRTERIDG